MNPGDLSTASFVTYTSVARSFAVRHLALLQRLPLTVCPSFLQQIQQLETSFPAELQNLEWQCASLQQLPADRFAALVAPLASLTLSDALRAADWVNAPAGFVSDLTAHLWSSGQLNPFRTAIKNLFAAIPQRDDSTHRLVIVLLGQGAAVDGSKVLQKLRRQGVLLNHFDSAGVLQDISAVQDRYAGNTAPYAHWYVDGGVPYPQLVAGSKGRVVVSYPGLSPIRERVLHRMQATIASGSGGAEQMRTRLADTTRTDIGARDTTADPVLQRFYTELFTQSSGPQIFSTSFVQWTGRELARRVQPETVLLRYAPRQRHRDMNELFADDQAAMLDPQGSLRDAEMGAYYNWIEMNRICVPGKLTFAAIVEGQPYSVVVGPNAPAASVCATPMGLQQALQQFG